MICTYSAEPQQFELRFGSSECPELLNQTPFVELSLVLTVRKQPEPQCFFFQAQVLSMLSHRNIIQFYGAVTKEPHYCLITGAFRQGEKSDHHYARPIGIFAGKLHSFFQSTHKTGRFTRFFNDHRTS